MTPPLAMTAAELETWCVDNLGSKPVSQIFDSGHLSRVTGVSLADGREVVIKARPDHARLMACYQVQKHLANAGYPCPAPLTPPILSGGLAVSAERYMPGGQVLSFADTSPELFALGLAELVNAAANLPGGLDLAPSPPWVTFDADSSLLWPPPDDLNVDLNDPAHMSWIDDAATAARQRISRYQQPAVYGHGDWYAANIPCDAGRIHAVHDWDSVVCEPEPVIVGVAAAIFPGTGQPGEVASVAQSEAFLRAYAAARDRSWTTDDEEVCWAASVWTRAFDAKKETFRTGSVAALHHDEAIERLRRAGVSAGD